MACFSVRLLGTKPGIAGAGSEAQNSRSQAWLILIRATATPKFGFVLAKLALVGQNFSNGAGRARKLVTAYW